MKTDLKNCIRDIPDFPKKGILFRDITPLLKDKAAFRKVINLLARKYRNKKIDLVVAAEARGFIFGGALAQKLKAGFIPVRKKGKLPYKTISVTYDLEYGTDTFQIHKDAIERNDRVLIMDDLLATGGTSWAITRLIKQLKGKIVGIVFLIELTQLQGRKRLKGLPVYSLIRY